MVKCAGFEVPGCIAVGLNGKQVRCTGFFSPAMPELPPQRLSSVGLSSCHCEQSWEGDKSRLVSPDTGLKTQVQEICGRHIRTGDIAVPAARIFPDLLSFQRGRLEFTQEIKMHQKIITIALFGAITLPFAAFADTTTLDEIVVTATRLPQPLSGTIADTTVLNAQDIRNSGAPDVATLLRSVAGIEIVQSGGLGSQSSIFMRGTNSNQVLVLLDGVRIDSATTGATAIDQIMPDSIERIEIVRGNVSSLYGSEAIGGVIQLFTKLGHGAPAFNASAGAGSHGTQHYSAGFSGAVNDTSFNINAANLKTNGVSAINPQLAPGANPNNNGYDNTTFNAQIKQSITADHALTASVFSSRGNRSFDISGTYLNLPNDFYNSIENIDKLALISDNQLNSLWHSQVRLSQGTDDIHSYKNTQQSSRIKTQNNQLAWQNNFKLSDIQNLTFSAERLEQAVTSDANTVYTQTSRKVNSLLAGYTGEFGAQRVQFNVRRDNYSDFGAAHTSLLGYGLSFADNWRATASISNAFKAPTFNDMYAPTAWGGNPNLQPERSQNREAGLHYAANGQRIDVVYFNNSIRDLIVYQYPLMINIDKAHITGQELSYAGDFDGTHLKASATFQNPRDVSTGAVLQRRARQFGNLSVTHDYNNWNLGAEIRYSGVRQDVNYTPYPSVAVALPAYQLFNVTAKYQINKQFSLSARLDNLFNRDYSEAYSYNTLGRTLFIGLTYQQ
jgi:vitamin B12 transporter